MGKQLIKINFCCQLIMECSYLLVFLCSNSLKDNFHRLLYLLLNFLAPSCFTIVAIITITTFTVNYLEERLQKQVVKIRI